MMATLRMVGYWFLADFWDAELMVVGGRPKSFADTHRGSLLPFSTEVCPAYTFRFMFT